MSFVTYHPYYKQRGHFMERETVYCDLNGNMVEGVGCPGPSRCRVASWVMKQSAYVTTIWRFSQADEIGM